MSDLCAKLCPLGKPFDTLTEPGDGRPDRLFSEETLSRIVQQPLDQWVDLYVAFVENAWCFCRSRSPFSTKTRTLGLGPRACRLGDSIAVFRGYQTPIILRPQHGGNQCLVVGEAYLHSFMEGKTLI